MEISGQIHYSVVSGSEGVFKKSNGFQINLSNTDRCWCGEEDRTKFFSVMLPIPGRKKRNACKSRINSSKLRKTK